MQLFGQGLVPFHIVRDNPKTLSKAVGLQDHFNELAWKQIHKTSLPEKKRLR